MVCFVQKLTCYYNNMHYVYSIRPLKVLGFRALPAIMKSTEIKGLFHA